jgi:uncharacterized protein
MGGAGGVSLIAEVTHRMVRYNGSDVRRINHALKVTAFATLIAEREGCDAPTVELVTLAGLLHDIGIHLAEEKHGSSAGKWQEIEGPAVAAELLEGLDLSPGIVERVCFLVGHHHTYSAVDGVDFQVLIEADFIVNAFEDELSSEAIARIERQIFRTRYGRELLDGLFPRRGEAGE